MNHHNNNNDEKLSYQTNNNDDNLAFYHKIITFLIQQLQHHTKHSLKTEHLIAKCIFIKAKLNDPNYNYQLSPLLTYNNKRITVNMLT